MEGKCTITCLVLLALVAAVHCGKLTTLQRKIYHMESSIQQDLHMMRETIDANVEEINILAQHFNDSLGTADNADTHECQVSINTTADNFGKQIEDLHIGFSALEVAFQDQKLQIWKLKDSSDLTGELSDSSASRKSVLGQNEAALDQAITPAILQELHNIKRDVLEDVSSRDEKLLKTCQEQIYKVQTTIEMQVAAFVEELKTTAMVQETVVNDLKTRIDLGQADIRTTLSNQFQKQLASVKQEIGVAMTNLQQSTNSILRGQQREYTQTMNTFVASVNQLNHRYASISSGFNTLSGEVNMLKQAIARNQNSNGGPNIRLVNGGQKSGRLEVFYNGQWGTVCDDLFNSNAATVVCRSLGYTSGIVKDRAYYGEGTGSILFDDVRCSGSELSIFDCRANRGPRIGCRHAEDVGVQCK